MNEKFINKNFYIVGLGKTGIASFNFIKDFAQNIWLWDDKNIPTEFNNYAKSPEQMEWDKLDYILLSPGIPTSFPTPHPIAKLAQQHNIKIISDLDILFAFSPNSYFIGITGTNGKSTTTSLVYHILKEAGFDACIGGNIGIPVLELITHHHKYFVLELSSFQLELMHEYRFNIAAMLNITPDHLDRHGNLENYIEAKLKIFKHQSAEDLAVIATDNIVTKDIYYKTLPSLTNAQKINVSCQNIQFDTPHLPGKHNKENIAVAYAIAQYLKINDEKIIKAINSFKPLTHRMEFVRSINNINYYNDSKATNAEASIAAVTSFKQCYIILGGVAKEGGIEQLIPFFSHIKKAYLIGKASADFAQTLGEHNVPYIESQTLANAIDNSSKDAKNDYEAVEKYIILSPACASYDQFSNFEQRGDEFKKLVQAL